MASRPLRRVPGLQPEVLSRLQKANLHTCRDVLSKTELELLQLLNISVFSIRDLLHAVSNVVAPSSRTMWAVHAKLATDTTISDGEDLIEPNHLRTSLSSLDELLRVGIPAGTITEVVGPSSVGKSQFCHMLAVIATLPRHLGGLDSGVIILDTESSFSAERLVEIAKSRFPFHFSDNVEDFIRLTSRVHVYTHINTSESLLQKLQTLQTEIIEKKVKLLVIDSIAALIRKEFDGTSIVQRQNLLMKEATLLKYLAENFQIPVVVTNQVTSSGGPKTGYSFTNTKATGNQRKGFCNNGVTAALGTVWAHCVNTRLVFEYSNTSDATQAMDSGIGSQRQIVVAKSPVAPVFSLPYVITSAGIELMMSPEDGQEVVNVNSNNYWDNTIQSRPVTTPGAVTEAQHTMVAEQQHLPLFAQG